VIFIPFQLHIKPSNTYLGLHPYVLITAKAFNFFEAEEVVMWLSEEA
jgi:hypothetical protein